MVGWADDASLNDKIRVLDERTRGLDRQVGELQMKVEETAADIRREFDTHLGVVREDMSAIRHSVRDFRRSRPFRTTRGGIPIVVIGVVLGGLSADAGHVPLWLGWTVVVVLVGWALHDSWRIWRRWRDAQLESS